MKNSKKILSIVLAVVMALSVMTIAASAHTSTWAEVADAVNIKLEVTQVPSATMSDGTGTYTAVNNDIYAVTVYAKTPANTGILYLALPIQFDSSKFSPLMTIDSGNPVTPYSYGQETWTTDTSITTPANSLPARYSDTNSYDASGTVQTAPLKIKTIGLGTVASYLSWQTEWIGKDDTRATSWYGGITDTNLRLCYVCLDDTSATAKVSFLNTDKGILITGEYQEMCTLYFQRNSGVSEEAALTNTFGIADASNFGTQLTTRTTTTAYPAGYNGAQVNPKYVVNYVANAKTTRVAPLADFSATGAKSQQIMFFNASGDKATISTCDYRFVAQFSNTMFPIAYDTSYNITSTNVTECGFVIANTSASKTEADLTAFTAAQLSACASGSELATGIKKVSTANISTTTAGSSNFAFSARITNIPVAATNVAPTAYEYNAVPYVISGGTAYYGAMQTSNVNGRFTTYNATYLASLA